MLPIFIEITKYDFDTNTCTAKRLDSAMEFTFDPFVSCAIALSDEDYIAGRGSNVVGNRYLVTEYTVYECSVVPCKITEIKR